MARLMEQSISLRKTLESKMYELDEGMGPADMGSLFSLQRQIFLKKIDPREDWCLQSPEIVDQKLANAAKAMRYHLKAGWRQVAYYDVLHFRLMTDFYDIENERVANARLNQGYADLAEALAWGFHHLSFAQLFWASKARAYADRSHAGGKVKAEKKAESEVILKALVISKLAKERPVRGWGGERITTDSLTRVIEDLCDREGLCVGVKGDDLAGKILNYLIDDKVIRARYLENARTG